MHLSLLTMTLVLAISACGGSSGSSTTAATGGEGAGTSLSIDGLWSTSSLGMGSTLAITLTAKGSGDTTVSGTGTYNVGAIRTGSVTITGSYRAPATALTMTYDNGEVVTYSATVVSTERMQGKLTYRNGSSIDVEFVRP